MKNSFYTLWSIFLVIAMVYYGKTFLIPFALSVFFWLIMSYQVWLLDKIFPYKRSVVSIIVWYIVLLWWILYGIWASAWYIEKNTSSLIQQIEETYAWYEAKVKSNRFIKNQHIKDLKEQWKKLLTLDTIWWIAWWTLHWLSKWLLIFVLSLLFLLNEKRIEHSMKKTLNNGEEILDIAKKVIAQYCYWLLILVSILFVLNTIWLLIFGVPYAPLIGWFSALATLIPTVWTLIWWIWATLVWWFLEGSLLVWVWIFVWYIAIQQIEEYFIMPKVVGERVSLNTLASIISLVVWWMLWWVAWLFLAIPTMWVVQKLFEKNNHPFWVLISSKPF